MCEESDVEEGSRERPPPAGSAHICELGRRLPVDWVVMALELGGHVDLVSVHGEEGCTVSGLSAAMWVRSRTA